MEITVNLDNNNKHAIASSYPRAGDPLRTVNSVGYLIWMAVVVIHWLKRGFVKIALEEKNKLLPPSQGNMLFSKRAYRP